MSKLPFIYKHITDMSYKSLVSIIIPAFNAEKYILETMKSIYKQSYKNFEIIVVNDGSVDDTEKIVKQEIKKQENSIFLLNQRNKGVSVARNCGIKKANGNYIAFMDSDDLWHEEKLREQLLLINEEKSDFCFCNLVDFYLGENINKIDRKPHIRLQRDAIICDKFLDKLLRHQFVITPSSFLAKKNILKDIKFDSTFLRAEDFDFFVRLSSKKDLKISYLDKIYVYHRCHENNATICHYHEIRMYVLKTYEKFFQKNHRNLNKISIFYEYLYSIGKQYFSEKNYITYLYCYKYLLKYKSFFRIKISIHQRALISFFKK